MKIRKTNGTLSMGQKRKFPAIALGLGLAMTATTWGQVWDGDAADGLWNTATNWDGDLVPTGSNVSIANGDSVTLSVTAGDTNFLGVKNNSKLNITTDLDESEDMEIDSGGEVTLTSGYLDLHSNKIKIGDGNSTGSPSFFMDGGTVDSNNKLEIYGTGIFQYKAGSLLVDDTIELEGTFKVVGYDAAGSITFDGREDGSAAGTFEFVPNAAGEITPITMGTVLDKAEPRGLVVDLDAFTAAASMMLFDASATEAPFNSISITKTGYGALTLGTQGALLDGEYFLDYAGGLDSFDVVLEVNVTGAAADPEIISIAVLGNGDVVLTTDVAAAGLTAQQSEDLTLGTFTDVVSTPLGNTLTIDSLLVDPNADGADFYRVY